LCFFFFFFSSRRRHTRFSRDWSSDVCSSDLDGPDLDPRNGPEGVLAIRLERFAAGNADLEHLGIVEHCPNAFPVGCEDHLATHRSEERRVGKECRSRWAPCQSNEKTNK